ncbi:MFS transporter [Kordia sp. YSTF-M3]|uniref:MFS transporter n=1 Tax=Kordia aestuariivivens TaxID=2759037 RepID=A0ABR7Q866_9FLAO|nr:MFS transporter [Kordia aestuariivivens]MBC8754764.1 MFS transporter [Kordia aestuariivivens]
MQKNLEQTHHQNILIYLLSNIFERAGYYGTRSILIVYAFSELKDAYMPAMLNFYALMASLLIITQLLGGLLGDLLLKNKRTIILGGIIQAIGAFVLCIGSENAVYASLLLLTLGSGLYRPNMIANFGKQYLQIPKRLDSGFSFFYASISIGSFIGVLLIGSIAETENWTYGFILAGLFFIISIILLLFSKELPIVASAEKIKTINQRVLKIVIACLCMASFWLFYDLGGEGTYTMQNAFIENSSTEISQEFFQEVNFYFTIPLVILLGILWMYKYINRFLKITIGFICAALSFYILLLVPEVPTEQYFYILLAAIFFIGMAEILIGPTIYAIITKHSNPKYLAIVMSVFFIIVRLFISLGIYIRRMLNEDAALTLEFAFSGMVMMAIILTIGVIFGKKYLRSNP